MRSGYKTWGALLALLGMTSCASAGGMSVGRDNFNPGEPKQRLATYNNGSACPTELPAPKGAGVFSVGV